MFWKKHFEKELNLRDENFLAIAKWQEMFDKIVNEHNDEIKQINNKINAIIECLNNDRKDINVLITMVKTLKTNKKRRK